jgi:hypothetical protein
MATYALTGTGQQTLTAGTVALHITITTPPTIGGHGYANPPDYYAVGYLRPGDGTGFWDPYPICGGPQWMPLPYATTVLAYALLNAAAVSVAEVAAPAPLAFPLASLPDVAISSPSATQVLTYNGTRWANAAPTGGGGGGTLTTASAVLASDVNIASGSGWVNALSITLAAGTWFVVACAQLVLNGTQANTGIRLWDGTTVYAGAEDTDRTATDMYQLTLAAILTPSASTTYTLQGNSGTGGGVKAQGSLTGTGNHTTYIYALKVA